MSGAGHPTAAPPPEAAPHAGEPGRWRKHALAAGFLTPAVFFLAIWIVYPTIRTIVRSFFDQSGDEFVWFENYEELFTSDILLTAIQNNAIWVGVVPALVSAVGLIFAVLTERIRFAVAFKTAVFMPMAISAFAAGVTWRIVYIKDPEQGALNAGIALLGLLLLAWLFSYMRRPDWDDGPVEAIVVDHNRRVLAPELVGLGGDVLEDALPQLARKWRRVQARQLAPQLCTHHHASHHALPWFSNVT